MSSDRRSTPSFEICHDGESTGCLLAGLSQYGLAGLTAVDYLVETLPFEETGYITAENLPTITPFENGRPRHHTRLFSHPDRALTILVGELFVPIAAVDPFCDAIVSWASANEVEDVGVLSGVPVPHGPENHRVFYVATDDYCRARLAESDVPPMGSGFLDGVQAGLVERGLDAAPGVGVLITPVHPPGPDVEAAIRLVEVVGRLYDLEIDLEHLETFAADIRQHYADLAERMETTEPDAVPEDRMYV